MSKKLTGGKKEKKKSKKPKAVPVHDSDLDSISLGDLKTYVRKLEKERTLMRKDRAFYIANKDKIMDFLVTMRDVYKARKETSLVKNSHIDDLIEQYRRFSETHYEKAIINDSEKARKKLEEMFSGFLERNATKPEHFDEEYDLEQQISEMDKQLQQTQYLYETSMTDELELLRKAEEELDGKHSKLLENALKQYLNESFRSQKDFNSDKIKMLLPFWDISEMPGQMRESFLNEIKDMQNFFYEISLNNKEVIKILKNKLDSLLIEEKKLNASLKETTLENIKFGDVQQTGFYYSKNVKAPVQHSDSIKNEQVEKKFEKLQFENEVLKTKLSILKKNWESLKKEFISATRMIYKTADFKALTLEEIIKKKLQMESVESEDEDPEQITTLKQSKEKDGAIEDGINILSLTIEDSDTIYVPPIYHEFWDPSLSKNSRRKYQSCSTITKVTQE